jgi:uncharacterized protein YkwD
MVRRCLEQRVSTDRPWGSRSPGDQITRPVLSDASGCEIPATAVPGAPRSSSVRLRRLALLLALLVGGLVLVGCQRAVGPGGSPPAQEDGVDAPTAPPGDPDPGDGAPPPSQPAPDPDPEPEPRPDPEPDPDPDPEPEPDPDPDPEPDPGPDPEPDPPPGGEPGLGTWAQRVLALVNEARSTPTDCGGRVGVQPATHVLVLESRLGAAAQKHSEDMDEHGFIGHVGSDGSTLEDRLAREGYAWWTIGENVAYGFSTPESVMSAWLSSPGHCANIMNASFLELGVGRSSGYWTQVFGRPR